MILNGESIFGKLLKIQQQLAETGGDLGSFVADAVSNKIVDDYINKWLLLK